MLSIRALLALTLTSSLTACGGAEEGSPVEETTAVAEDALIAPSDCDGVYNLMDDYTPWAPVAWAYFTYIDSAGRVAMSSEMNWLAGSGFSYASLAPSAVRVHDLDTDPNWPGAPSTSPSDTVSITFRRVWRTRIVNGVPLQYLTAPSLALTTGRFTFSATPSECLVSNGVGTVAAVDNAGNRVLLRVVPGYWPG